MAGKNSTNLYEAALNVITDWVYTGRPPLDGKIGMMQLRALERFVIETGGAAAVREIEAAEARRAS